VHKAIVWIFLFAVTALLVAWHISSPAETATAAAAAQRQPPIAVKITFGAADQAALDWSGSLSVEGGTLLKLEEWQFSGDSRITGPAAWRAFTQLPSRTPTLFECAYVELGMLKTGVIATLDAGEDAKIRVQTAQGAFEFTLGDLPPGRPRLLLNGRALVERTVVTDEISQTAAEDDYPAAAIDSAGGIWVAWLAYQGGGDEILARRRDEGTWSQTTRVTRSPGNNHSPAVVSDGRSTWILWPHEFENGYEIQASRFGDGAWSSPVRLTDAEGPDILVKAAAGGGSAYAAWQGFRNGQSDVFLSSLEGDKWSVPVKVSESTANDWAPAVAVDRKGRAWIVWDSYEKNSYNILARSYSAGQLSPTVRITDSSQFHANADVAVDVQDRPWFAWEESEANWGKDYAFLVPSGRPLYQDRRIRVGVLDGSEIRQPNDSFVNSLPENLRRYNHNAQLRFDSKGRLWLLFRSRTFARLAVERQWANGGRWENFASFWNGDRWSSPIYMSRSNGPKERSVAAIPLASGVLAAFWTTDGRPFAPAGPGPGVPVPETHFEIMGAQLEAREAPAAEQKLVPIYPELPGQPPVHASEPADLKRIRGYRAQVNGKIYGIYRGDFHRHTDISGDGAGDGSLLDLYRYSLDAAGLEYVLVADHSAGNNNEYTWWRTQKSEDLFRVPGRFSPFYGYERSVGYPNGHRNVVFAQRGNRTLPITPTEIKATVNSGSVLYPYLRKLGGLTLAHTSSNIMGTDWRDNDPDLEPLVEVYQGFRTSSEHEGAPRAASRDDKFSQTGADYKEAGFVWRAWEKGYRLGLIAASDHISTHVSYGMLYAEDGSREALMRAMRERHAYAATDNIILDFRASTDGQVYFMGDSGAASAPRFTVKAVGTRPIARVDLIKDNRYVLSRTFQSPEVEFTYIDTETTEGEKRNHWYYVRVEQIDGQLAWGSPIWLSR
jgi:hypothetical protein